ncbi:hypothetical protein MHYP_G00105900 [Metynnis hypsauchen]
MCRYGHWPNSFFRKLGIPGPKPLPLLGNMLEYRKGFHALDMECFMKYGRIWGIYEGRTPVLCVLDRTIIKSVLVKECYSLFTNRRDFRLNGPLYDALFVTVDEDWKRIRNILSPCFTSGRLKEMFGIMKTHSDTLVRNLEKKTKQNSGVHVKDSKPCLPVPPDQVFDMSQGSLPPQSAVLLRDALVMPVSLEDCVFNAGKGAAHSPWGSIHRH